jgi:hypothetical protein
MSHRGRTLEIYQPGVAYYRMRLQPDGSYAIAGSTLRFENDNAFLLNGDRYLRVKPYKPLPADSNFVPIGGTFSLNDQVPFYAFSYYGYDISAMNPMDLQRADGQKKPVFALPADDSRDFYIALKTIVPYGMLYASDSTGTSQSSAITVTSGSENAETQSTTLGISIGVPKVVSFGVESEVTKTAKKTMESQKQLAFTEDVKITRSLVLDPAHVRLDPAFRQRIVDIAAKRRAGIAVDYEKDVIAVFGTHYPNAVTLGNLSRRVTSYSKDAYGELYSQGKTIAVNASGVVRGVKIDGKYQNQSEYSQAFNSELERQFKQTNDVGDSQDPVPAFMDLRTLDELLSPVFFDDVAIFGDMRMELRQAIGTHVAARAPPYDPIADDWEPYAFSVNLDRMVQPTQNGDFGYQYPSVFGDLGFDTMMKGRTPNIVDSTNSDTARRLWAKSFVEVIGYPITTQLPKTPVSYFFTAKEICKGFPNVIDFGGTLSLQSGIFSNSTDQSVTMGHFIYPKQLGTADSEAKIEFEFSAKNKRTILVPVYAKARRLADIDGRFRPLPKCP